MGIETILGISGILVNIGTPLAIIYVGTRYVANIKEKVSTEHGFNKKWADDFYKISSEYMQCMEKYAAYLHFLNVLQNPNDELGAKLQKELPALDIMLCEYGLSIRRFSALSPVNKDALLQSSKDMLDYVTQIRCEKQGSFDTLISLQHTFNTCSRKAHAEMLKIK